MAGYSATPLWKKLGLKPGLEAVAEGRPGDYIALLALPDDVRVTWAPKLSCETQLVHVFETKLSKLSARLAKLRVGYARTVRYGSRGLRRPRKLKPTSQKTGFATSHFRSGSWI